MSFVCACSMQEALPSRPVDCVRQRPSESGRAARACTSTSTVAMGRPIRSCCKAEGVMQHAYELAHCCVSETPYSEPAMTHCTPLAHVTFMHVLVAEACNAHGVACADKMLYGWHAGVQRTYANPCGAACNRARTYTVGPCPPIRVLAAQQGEDVCTRSLTCRHWRFLRGGRHARAPGCLTCTMHTM